VRRAVDDAAARTIVFQKASMEVATTLPESIRSVVLIDDVFTSGATMKAAIELIHAAYPHLKIFGLAFGETQPTGSTPFPEVPVFPDLNVSSLNDLQSFSP